MKKENQKTMTPEEKLSYVIDNGGFGHIKKTITLKLTDAEYKSLREFLNDEMDTEWLKVDNFGRGVDRVKFNNLKSILSKLDKAVVQNDEPKNEILKRNKRGFTELEERLISAIDNFILWYTTESDREIVEEFIEAELSCDVDYNEWFELRKEKK